MNNEKNKKIPKGHYCYNSLRYNKDNNKFKVIGLCPFFEYIDNLELYYCGYLDSYGYPNHETNKTEEDLIKFFGSKEILDKKISLTLLFDQVKECNVNL